MSQETPDNIIRSWNLQANFQTGPVRVNKLVPPKYGRSEVNFITTWREDPIDSRLDWDTRNFSVLLPESLRVLTSIYVNVQLPALAQGAYKKYPALYVFDRLTIYSGGQEVYTVDYRTAFGDYLQSLTNEQLNAFAKTYLGHQDTMDGTARSVMIPVLLPNSAYLGRNGHDTRGHGVFPAYLGNSRLELQFTTNPATFIAADSQHPPGSIANQCKLMYHEVKMTSFNMKGYEDQRNKYSIVNRRFTELTSGWTEYASANTEVTLRHSQPQGCITEIQIIAVPEATDDRHQFNFIKPSLIRCTADARVQRDLDSPEKIEIELWQNGFVSNDDFPRPGRMCFANHASEVGHTYTGGYNMSLASNVDFTFKFPSACRYKVIAVQLQRVKIDQEGRLAAYLN